MDDDFNTPVALSVLFDLARELNRASKEGLEDRHPLAATLRTLGGVLGLLQQDAQSFLRAGAGGAAAEAEEIESLIAARNAARAAKDWAEADRIRDALHEQGIELLDSREGTTWRRLQARLQPDQSG